MDSTIAIPAQMVSRRRGRGGENKARDLAGEMALQGPINLIQGFPGYIVRQPVFIGQDGKSDYWGVVSVVFAETTFLEELQLDRYAGQYDIAIQVVEENNPVSSISTVHCKFSHACKLYVIIILFEPHLSESLGGGYYPLTRLEEGE